MSNYNLSDVTLADLIAELQRRGWRRLTMADGLTRIVDMEQRKSDGDLGVVVLERDHDDAPAHFLYRLGALT